MSRTGADRRLSRVSGGVSSLAAVSFEPYDGPATFHVDRLVYRIPRLRLLVQRSTSSGETVGLERPVAVVLDRGELPKDRTSVGELRLGDRQEFIAWWTGFRFEL
jgi:hypothetical protein